MKKERLQNIFLVLALIVSAALAVCIFTGSSGQKGPDVPKLTSEQILAAVYEAYEPEQVETLRLACRSGSYSATCNTGSDGCEYCLVEFVLTGAYEVPTMQFKLVDDAWRPVRWTWADPDTF